MHSCGGAFDRVRQPSGIPASRLDQLAWEAVLGNPVSEIPRVVLSESAEGPDGYPPEWGGLEAGKQAAGVLLAIAAGMAQQVDTVVSAHDGEIDTVSMTGGLSAAPILRQAFRVALAELGHTPQLRVSQREVARDQAAAWGAMLTAWRNDADLASVISACCPNEACLVDSALDSRLGEYMAEVLG